MQSSSQGHGQSPQPVREVGTLRALSDGKSQFVGSSSGVYFVNTVRKSFAAVSSEAGALSQASQPSPEDCIVGDDVSETGTENGLYGADKVLSGHDHASSLHIIRGLGKPPSRGMAKQLMMLYFQSWHPIFPFLHGPTFLKDIETFYAPTEDRRQRSIQDHADLVRSITFQCIFNIASLDGPQLPLKSKIGSPVHVLTSLSVIALKSDIASIQALLAAQLYLVATMSLRAASTVGGLIFRSILHAGLHRCPVRYEQLSNEDCDIRKRIFWSAYAIDRYLSQALGHPLGIQDSDIDVCSPAGPELHRLDAFRDRGLAEDTPRSSELHLPLEHNHQIDEAASPERTNLPVRDPNEHESPERAADEDAEADADAEVDVTDIRDAAAAMSQRRRSRQSALAHYVRYGRLTGRALELFHKSIHVRKYDSSAILYLRADIDAWWNALPSFLQENPVMDRKQSSTVSHGGVFDFGALFTILYQQLILLINRPWLSLEPDTPEFRSALQTCIGASRKIISTLKVQLDMENALFWPGYLSAAWMAGLIVAFGCQLRLYAISKGSREITACLELLTTMARRWRMANHCHAVLSSLMEAFQKKRSRSERLSFYRPSISGDHGSPLSSADTAHQNPIGRPRSKRLRTGESGNIGTGHDEHHTRTNGFGDAIEPSTVGASSSLNANSVSSQLIAENDINGRHGISEIHAGNDRAAIPPDGMSVSPLHAPPPVSDFNLSGANQLDRRSQSHGLTSLRNTQDPDYLNSWIPVVPQSNFGVTPGGLAFDEFRRSDGAGSSDWDPAVLDIFEGATWESLLNVMDGHGNS